MTEKDNYPSLYNPGNDEAKNQRHEGKEGHDPEHRLKADVVREVASYGAGGGAEVWATGSNGSG